MISKLFLLDRNCSLVARILLPMQGKIIHSGVINKRAIGLNVVCPQLY